MATRKPLALVAGVRTEMAPTDIALVNTCGGIQTVSATGITTLTVASPQAIRFTSANQTCKLPVTTTLPDGLAYYLINDGTTELPVTDSAGSVVGSISVGGFGRAIKLPSNTWRIRQDAPFVGVFANQAALPAIATPGHFATTLDGGFYVQGAS